MTTCYLRNVLSILLYEISRYYWDVKKRERQKRDSVFEFGHKGLVKKYRAGGGAGCAGAFGNVADKKHMTHPLPSTQK